MSYSDIKGKESKVIITNEIAEKARTILKKELPNINFTVRKCSGTIKHCMMLSVRKTKGQLIRFTSEQQEAIIGTFRKQGFVDGINRDPFQKYKDNIGIYFNGGLSVFFTPRSLKGE